MADIGRPTPRLWYADWQTGLRELAIAIQAVMRGQTNNAGSATLTANAASTTVTDPDVGENTKVMLQPTSATAAAGWASTYVSSKADGSFVITHPNTADADKTVDYLIGG